MEPARGKDLTPLDKVVDSVFHARLSLILRHVFTV